MGGSLFSSGSVIGDSPITGQDSNLYLNNVDISSPVDNSQYTDLGQDPVTGSSGSFLSSIDSVVNDAFKAYQISQTPTSYRAAAPGSPAAIAAQSQASTAKTTNTALIGGIVIVALIIMYFIFKKG